MHQGCFYMLLDKLIKNKIFPSSTDQRKLIQKVGGANFKEAFDNLFFKTNETKLQKILSSFLREKTVDYMRNAKSECMLNQREKFEMQVLADGPFDEYHTWDSLIEGQKKDTKWGTNFEAVALADLLDLGLLVSWDGRAPRRLREISEGNLIISLFQSGNHWFLEDGSSETLGDGNCLYNAFSRAIRFNLLIENKDKLSSDIKSELKLEENISVYKTQSELLNIYQNAPIPSSEELKKIILSNVKLSELDDHQLAFQLAQAEIDDAPHVKTQEEYITDFDNQLKKMCIKKRALLKQAKLDPSNYEAAAAAAVKLTRALGQSINAFKHKQDYIKFNTGCMQAINEAKKTLDPFPSWKQILTNIVVFVVSLGAIYVGAAIHSKVTTGRFMLFPPAFVEEGYAKECAKNIAELRNTTNKIANGS